MTLAETVVTSVLSLGINFAAFVAILVNISREDSLAKPVGVISEKSFNSLQKDSPWNKFCNITVLRNRVIVVLLAMSSISAIDPVGHWDLFSVSLYYSISMVHSWAAYMILAEYSCSWIYVLLDFQQVDRILLKRLKIAFLCIVLTLKTLFITYFIIGLQSRKSTCVHAYLSVVYFWIASGTFFVVSCSSITWKTVRMLQESQFKEKNRSQVQQIIKKTKMISFVFGFIAFYASYSLISKQWDYACAKEFVPVWSYMLIQISSSTLGPVFLVFNWIPNDPPKVLARAASNGTTIGNAAAATAAARNSSV